MADAIRWAIISLVLAFFTVVVWRIIPDTRDTIPFNGPTLPDAHQRKSESFFGGLLCITLGFGSLAAAAGSCQCIAEYFFKD